MKYLLFLAAALLMSDPAACSTNLLSNSAFENIPPGVSCGSGTYLWSGWRYYSLNGAGGSLVTVTPGREDNITVKLSRASTSGDSAMDRYNSMVSATAGRLYYARIWARSDTSGSLDLSIVACDTGRNQLSVVGTKTFQLDQTYRSYDVQCTSTPANTAYLNYVIRVHGTGTVYFDDCELSDQPLTISYTPLSDAARLSGQLDLYNSVPMTQSQISADGYSLSVQVPQSARAYDVIPVRYTLTKPAGDRKVAVEAVAFEDHSKAGDTPLYDLAIPGDVSLNLEYLGSACADWDETKHIPYTVDALSPISPFPPFKNRDPLVTSSTIRVANFVWFKFRLTNTGTTVLDPEGCGASFIVPTITKLRPDGSEEWTAQTTNAYERHLNYLYPGDSYEFWVNFSASAYFDFGLSNPEMWCYGLKEGNFKIKLNSMWRYQESFADWGTNEWSDGGRAVACLEMPIQVTATGGNTPVQSTYTVLNNSEKMPLDMETFEEFMTSYRVCKGAGENATRNGVMYLQVAPWTQHVVAKLITSSPRQLAVAKIPIQITNDTLAIQYNSANKMVVTNNGREDPVIIAMELPGFRVGIQQGPYPEDLMLQRLQELKNLGTNVISDAASYWFPEIANPSYQATTGAIDKYFHDVLLDQVGMKSLGFSVYPPNSVNVYGYGLLEALTGNPVNITPIWDGTDPNNKVLVDRGEPLMPVGIAEIAKWQYKRWGDHWYVTKDGKIPIEVEDSWGKLSNLHNLRLPEGPLAYQLFRDWLVAKYGTIASLNAAWGSTFASFDEINPENDAGEEGDGIPYKMVFNRLDRVFHDWSPAMNDWDTFRTKRRLDIYRQANQIIQQTIPNAELSLRTESTNLPIDADPQSEIVHMRNAYYDEHRCALVNEVLKQENVIHFYSNYMTIPLSQEEWRQGMREMVGNGITPIFLPGFVDMMDPILNPYYGREYQINYNLAAPTKGWPVRSLMAAYPWWKATYEEGGAPGIIFSDYTCDLFATETQKREMQLLRTNFNSMLDALTPGAPAAPTDAGQFTNKTSVTFNWTPPASAPGGVLRYNCQVGTTPGGNNVFDGDVGSLLTKSITGSNGGTYYCRVQPVGYSQNPGPWSDSSDGIMVDTLPPNAPATPAAAARYIKSTSVTFAWQAATDTGSGVADYKCSIGYSPGGYDTFYGYVGNVLSKTVTGAHNQTYYCRVLAKDGVNNTGPWSPSSAAVTVDLVVPASGVASAPPSAAGPISINYSGASDTLSGLNAVELWSKKGSGGVWTDTGLTSTGANGSFSFSPAQGNGTYYFDLVAEDNAGNRSSAPSGNGDATTVYYVIPSSIVDAKSHADGTMVNISGVVTAGFGDYFYIEAVDRSAGLRIAKANHTASIGTTVEVIGTVSTLASGERFVNADSIVGS